jgi:cytochrome c oxidase cbb3-type subunit 4
METYSLLREFADSWMLLFLFVFFIGIIFWAFRPGSRQAHDDSADIPFRHEKKPAADTEERAPRNSSAKATTEEKLL